MNTRTETLMTMIKDWLKIKIMSFMTQKSLSLRGLESHAQLVNHTKTQ